jgi:N-acetylglucosaminyldiphosphoundecaprenol N-acetyl-beta-D-mannosaminyltransferase
MLGAQIDVLSWDDAMTRLLGWAQARESRYVTICNVHVVVSASRDAAYRDVINASDMATPDGAPVAWMLRRLGFAGQRRISGPDLMWALCERVAKEGLPIYCYGSTGATLALLEQRLRAAFPDLKMTMESPPFRALSPEEDAAAVARIHASGAGIVFVGLGCPKQERWMAEHRGTNDVVSVRPEPVEGGMSDKAEGFDKLSPNGGGEHTATGCRQPLQVNAVMIGVGAAFDFHAGTVQRAPVWMRDNGLEWLHRLLSEPGRLWKRYLVTNTLFVVGAARQLLSGKS